MDPEWSAHGNLAPASSACLHELVAATCVGTDHETDRSIVPASFHLHDPAVSALALVVKSTSTRLRITLAGLPIFAKPTSDAAPRRSGIVSVSLVLVQFPTLSHDVA